MAGEDSLPARVWIEIFCLGARPPDDVDLRWCETCCLPSMTDYAWAYVDSETLRVIGHSLTRYCPDCDSSEAVEVRGSG